MTTSQLVLLMAPQKRGSTDLMLVQCAWCKGTIDYKFAEAGGVSHGICPECKAKLLREWHGGQA